MAEEFKQWEYRVQTIGSISTSRNRSNDFSRLAKSNASDSKKG